MTKPALTPLPDALTLFLQQTSTVAETEQLPLHQLNGRVLAEDVISAVNVPPFDNSAMDGYAFAHRDLLPNKKFTISGKSLAGAPYAKALQSNDCIRITTGALIPPGADTVVMQENTLQKDNQITVVQQPELGENIRRAGKDIASNAMVMKQHTRLTPERIALLASIGRQQASVYRKIRISIFGTGDELIEPGQTLAAGQIYNSNSYGLRCAIDSPIAECIDVQILPDDPQKIRTQLLSAAARSDLILTSGGVSVGDADYIKQVIEELGELRFWKLAIKPGKPLAFGKIEQCTIIGLPGNPVSSMVTFRLVAQPVIDKLAGGQYRTPVSFTAITRCKLHKTPGRADFQRGILSQDTKGQWWVDTTGSQSSGILNSLNAANCLIALSIDDGNIDAGEEVVVIPINDLG